MENVRVISRPAGFISRHVSCLALGPRADKRCPPWSLLPAVGIRRPLLAGPHPAGVGGLVHQTAGAPPVAPPRGAGLCLRRGFFHHLGLLADHTHLAGVCSAGALLRSVFQRLDAAGMAACGASSANRLALLSPQPAHLPPRLGGLGGARVAPRRHLPGIRVERPRHRTL